MSEDYIYFKDKFTFEQRKQESTRIIQKYTNRIPVIVERAQGCKNVDLIDKNKYLIPRDLTLGQLQYVIRKRLTLTSEQGLFLFINEQMYPVTHNISQIYNVSHDDDKFLYIKYSGENTFG